MVSTVLVINNDSQVRGVVCAVLQWDGFVTVGVGNYPEAIERLSWSPADLAISDGFTTDGVTGASLLHRLFPALRLLVLSGRVACELEIPFGSEYLSILPKPCSLQALRQAVQQALKSEEDACLQEIIDRGRFGFLMAALRSPATGKTPTA